MIRRRRESILGSYRLAAAVLYIATLASAVTGCGSRNPKTYPVSGTVLFKDGTAVTWGTIEFHGLAKQAGARGEIGSDGSFMLSTFGEGDGAIPGEYQVTVTQITLPVDQPFKHQHAHPPGVARKHANPISSGITQTVRADQENKFKIEVEAESSRQGK